MLSDSLTSDIKIVINKAFVLVWIEQLEECRRRVAIISSTQLINLRDTSGICGYEQLKGQDVTVVPLLQ